LPDGSRWPEASDEDGEEIVADLEVPEKDEVEDLRYEATLIRRVSATYPSP